MRIIKLRGTPLSRGPPRPFWGSKPHDLNLIILMKTPGYVVIYRLISCSTK